MTWVRIPCYRGAMAMIRSPGRLPRDGAAGRTISVKMSPAEEDAIDAALFPGESRSAMIRSAALSLAKSRARSKAAKSAG